MRATLALAWRLARGGGALPVLLTAAAVAVSTGLLLFAVGGNHAFAQRADADAWRHPKAATGPATAVEALSTELVRGEPVTVVDLAALRDGAPVPPGMARFPKPGETWTSPALAAKRGDRFPTPTGLLGRDALVRPGELVAVVGHRPGDPAMTAERTARDTASPTAIDRYATGAVSSQAQIYRVLAIIASILMVVPLLVFGGAAARLTVARRDRRLAALRLVGATPGQVAAVTTAEAVLTAAAGAVIGALLYLAAIPALARIPIAGGAWFPTDLWPGPLPVAAVLACVPLLVGVSAIAGLRQVVVSPLGVARRQTPPALKAVRLLAFAALVITFGLTSGGLSRAGRTGLTILLIFLGLAFLALNLVGPWIVALIGRVTAATARGPALLLAGRRLMDDPRAVWRTVAGVSLTGFVAGFLSLMNPSPPAGRQPGVAERHLLDDLRTGALVVLAVSFLIAITSAAITSASSVLDRRQSYAMLRLAGTPLSVLDRARHQETLVPLAVMGGGSVLTGVFFATPFAAGFGTQGALTLALFLTLGTTGVLAATALTRPLLHSTTTPTPHPD
ncbi:FtsX-like permease family protein [Spirillospora sp. CA-294931]|uniref:FtsX-like permease family protein n=1 Tax=Spirillospora sp. CA-294931 TaxID=3240042 RepID=UPI003D8E68A4